MGTWSESFSPGGFEKDSTTRGSLLTSTGVLTPVLIARVFREGAKVGWGLGPDAGPGYLAGTRFRASRTRSGVKGTWVTRAPVASKTALARAAATGTTGGSPMPWVTMVELSAKTTSMRGM